LLCGESTDDDDDDDDDDDNDDGSNINNNNNKNYKVRVRRGKPRKTDIIAGSTNMLEKLFVDVPIKSSSAEIIVNRIV
jgi:hypothetical protein